MTPKRDVFVQARLIWLFGNDWLGIVKLRISLPGLEKDCPDIITLSLFKRHIALFAPPRRDSEMETRPNLE